MKRLCVGAGLVWVHPAGPPSSNPVGVGEGGGQVWGSICKVSLVALPPHLTYAVRRLPLSLLSILRWSCLDCIPIPLIGFQFPRIGSLTRLVCGWCESPGMVQRFPIPSSPSFPKFPQVSEFRLDLSCVASDHNLRCCLSRPIADVVSAPSPGKIHLLSLRSTTDRTI